MINAVTTASSPNALLAAAASFLFRRKHPGLAGPDAGHDSPEERQATIELSKYGQGTGPLGGAAYVRLFMENGSAMVSACLNPHSDDEITIAVTRDETRWACRFDPNKGAPSIRAADWMSLTKYEGHEFCSYKHAVFADRLVRRIFAKQLSAQPN